MILCVPQPVSDVGLRNVVCVLRSPCGSLRTFFAFLSPSSTWGFGTWFASFVRLGALFGRSLRSSARLRRGASERGLRPSFALGLSSDVSLKANSGALRRTLLAPVS